MSSDEMYSAVVRAILRVANEMGEADKKVILACLWQAGVHPSAFDPNWSVSLPHTQKESPT